MKKDQQKLIGIIAAILIVLGIGYVAFEGAEEIQEEVMEEAMEEKEEAAAATTSAPRYAGCTPTLSAEKSAKPRGILLKWSTCEDADFEVYQLVRSNTHSNPSYPADNTVHSSGNKNAANYTDTGLVPATTYHYRICAVKQQAETRCSGVASATF